MRRIALLGGTFDPVTLGHLAVVDAALRELNVAQVWLIPAGAPWQKSRVTEGRHRLQMLRLAVAGHTDVFIQTCELERPGPTLTRDTLAQLHAVYSDAEFMFLVGDDIELDSWVGIQECRQLASFVRVPRPGHPPRNDSPRLQTVDFECSSTQVRDNYSKHIDELPVPPSVHQYILAHGLYKQ